MLPVRQLAALWATLAIPMHLWAQGSVESTLGSICNSGPASLRSLQTDPLLSNFFELTCGKTIDEALGSTPLMVIPPSKPTTVRTEDNGPVVTAPLPKVPEVRIDPRLTSPSKPPSETMEQQPTVDGTPMFRQIELQGVHASSRDQLEPLLRSFIGKPISLGSLDQLTQAIQTWYRGQGMLARTLLPTQDLTEGKVLVNVVESEFTGVRIVDPKGLLRNTQVPKRLVESVQPVGEPLNLNQLEEAASRLRDLSGVQTSVQLSPGARAGETTATVSVQDGDASEIRLSADNHGSRATGEERIATNLRLNNITQRGDTLLANLLKSDGLDYVGVGYELPFTTRGWRFESRAAYSQYRLVDPVFSSADMKGPTRNLGVGIVIPLARNSRHSINLQTTIDTNRYENSALSNVLSRYRTTLLGAQIDGQHIDSDGRGQTQWAAQITRGELDLSDSPASYRTQDSAGPRTEGFFNKARMSFTRRNWIDPHNTVTATAQAQWASKNLDGSEKFYLGGPRGVRAYPVNEGGGSLGHLASLEWESMMLQNAFGRVSVAGFYDHGRVRLYEDSSNITSLNRNEYVLHGYGLWIGTQAKLTGGSLGLRLTIARRIGDNPGTTTGLDSDGTRVLNRVRLDANLAF